MLVFLITGAISATWVARLAEIKADLGASERELAMALLVWNAGAIVGLQSGGLLVPRLGSRASLTAALPAFALSLGLLAAVDSIAVLAAAWFVAGVTNGIVDVAMNAHGIALEETARRPLLSRLHAMHPIGGIVGGAIGALAASSRLPLEAHFAGLSILTFILAVCATHLLAPLATGPGGATRNAEQSTGWTWPLLGFGALAFCVTLAEGSMLDWSAVYLHEDLQASEAFAAAGVTAFLTGIAAGRLLGDRLQLRLGPVWAFRLGGGVAVSSLSAMLLIGTMWSGLIGIGLFGFGISYLLPLLLSTAGSLSSVPGEPARIVARVSTLGYLGSFTGPMLIGSIADITSLVLALTVPLVLVLIATIVARIDHPPAG